MRLLTAIEEVLKSEYQIYMNSVLSFPLINDDLGLHNILVNSA